MQKSNIDSVCAKLGEALNELSEIRKLHFQEVNRYDSKLINALGLMKSVHIKIENQDFKMAFDAFIHHADQFLREKNS